MADEEGETAKQEEAKPQKERKGKKHHNVKAWELYKVEGGRIIERPRLCPRCRKFMAQAGNREFCGGCGYTILPGAEKKPEQELPKADEKTVEEAKAE